HGRASRQAGDRAGPARAAGQRAQPLLLGAGGPDPPPVPTSPTGRMTPAEARERIRGHAGLHAFISLTEEDGAGPIVAVKDLVDVRGTVTTAGGSFPAGPVERDAPLIRRLRAAGCVVIGKTNLHEWAFGVTSTNPHHGAVGNPRAPGRVPGGSSGGSAAAVAAGL